MERLEQVLQLKQCAEFGENECHVLIDSHDKLDEYKEEIQQYQSNGQEFMIKIFFHNSSEYMVEVIDMIDQLNVNHRVGSMVIVLGNGSQLNEDIIQTLMEKYQNAYEVFINDYNDSADSSIHSSIKQLVTQSIVIAFALWFPHDHPLYSNNDGFELIKEYNQIIKDKQQHLEYLKYKHEMICGEQCADQQEEIEKLIDLFDNA